MFQFPGFALIPLWIQEISNSKSNQLPVTSHQGRPWSLFTDNWSLELGFPIRKFPDQSLFAAPRNLSQRTTSFIASQRQGIRRIPFRHLIVARNQKTEDRKQKAEEFIFRQLSFVIYRLIRIRSENLMQKTKYRSFHFRIPPSVICFLTRKDQFCFKHIRDLCGQAQITTGMLVGKQNTECGIQKGLPFHFPRSVFRSPNYRMRFLFTMSSCQKTDNENREPIVLGPATVSLEDRASRRAIQPSRKTAIFKPYISSECPSRHLSCFSVFRIPSSVLRNWWSWTGSNRRPHACKARIS
jgi:hypothetical protein